MEKLFLSLYLNTLGRGFEDGKNILCLKRMLLTANMSILKITKDTDIPFLGIIITATGALLYVISMILAEGERETPHALAVG
jgi:hypothetical protein